MGAKGIFVGTLHDSVIFLLGEHLEKLTHVDKESTGRMSVRIAKHWKQTKGSTLGDQTNKLCCAGGMRRFAAAEKQELELCSSMDTLQKPRLRKTRVAG